MFVYVFMDTCPDTQPALESAFNDAFLLNRCKLCRVFMEYTTGYRGVYSLKEDHLPWNNISLSRAFAMFRKKGSHSPVLVRWARFVDKALQQYEKTHTLLAPRLRRWETLLETAMRNEEFSRLVHRCGACKVGTGVARGGAGAGAAGVQERTERGAKFRAVEVFESALKFVLGENFWYEAECVGPDFDLYLWALLMLRFDACQCLGDACMCLSDACPGVPVGSAHLVHACICV